MRLSRTFPYLALAFTLAVVVWALMGLPLFGSAHLADPAVDGAVGLNSHDVTLRGSVQAEQTPPSEDPSPDAPFDGGTVRTIVGIVVSAKTEHPIEGAFVCAVDSEEAYVRESAGVRTDSAGYFKLQLPPLGECELFVHANGYLPRREPILELEASHTPVFAIHLSIGGELRGQVVDPHGTAIPDAEVLVCPVAASASWPAIPSQISARSSDAGGTAVSREDGSFVVGGLIPATEYVARARKPGYIPSFMSTVGVRAQVGDDVRIELHRLTTVTVRAVDDASGETIEHANLGGGLVRKGTGVYLHTHSRAYDRHVLGLPSGSDGAVCYLAESPRVAALGTERVEVTVHATALGYESVSTVAWVRLGQAAYITLRARRLTPDAWGQLALSAESESGVPFDGRLLLSASRDGAPASQVVCEFSKGRADVLGLPAGRWVIHADGTPPYGTWLGRVVSGAAVVVSPGQRRDLGMTVRAGRARLRVHDEEGLPLKGFALRVRSSGLPPVPEHDPWNATTADPTESALSENLVLWIPLGTAEFRVRLPGHETATVSAPILDASDPTDVLVVLRRLGR
jgi:hypothetical protein